MTISQTWIKKTLWIIANTYYLLELRGGISSTYCLLILRCQSSESKFVPKQPHFVNFLCITHFIAFLKDDLYWWLLVIVLKRRISTYLDGCFSGGDVPFFVWLNYRDLLLSQFIPSLVFSKKKWNSVKFIAS